jgi:hypothetical protein
MLVVLLTEAVLSLANRMAGATQVVRLSDQTIEALFLVHAREEAVIHRSLLIDSDQLPLEGTMAVPRRSPLEPGRQ